MGSSLMNSRFQGVVLFLGTGPVALALLSSRKGSRKPNAELTFDNLKRIEERETYDDYEDFEEEFKPGIPRNDSEWSLGLSRREFKKKVEELGMCDTGAVIVFAARVCTYAVISAWALRSLTVKRVLFS